jgi:xanthine phosphoribosyltransferase
MEKDFADVLKRVENLQLDENFDIVVAIANGGTIPAELIRQKLGLELFLLKINLRNSDHTPIFDSPKLLHDIDFEVSKKKILLVEDRVKTGSTLQFAKQILMKHGASLVKTLAVNGKADYALYNEDCFRFPWII